MSGKTSKDSSCVFILYINANAIEGVKSCEMQKSPNDTSSSSKVDMEFSKQDHEFFGDLKSGANPFK